MIARRQLLALTAALAQGLMTWPWRGALGAAPQDRVLQSCHALFSNRESALAIGRRYLELVPKERDEMLLAAQVLRALRGTPGSEPDQDAVTGLSKAAVSAAIRADFTKEQVVSLDGWLLARTEARICALIALQKREIGARLAVATG